MPAIRAPRVHECAHIYPDGRTCRRLPKRGEKLCLGHQLHRPRRPGQEDEIFEKQMTGWIDQLDAMPLEQILAAAQGSLAGIFELIDRKSSRAHRLAFARAGIAVGAAINKLDETIAGYRAHAITRTAPQHPTQSTPARAFAPGMSAELPNAGVTAEEKLQALDRLEALCGKLLSTLPSDDEPQSLCNEMHAGHRNATASATIRK